ncbi:hypothetical protein IMZ31_21360 (plasmid) [Pontibacillus sp. ALD_SL1]|uniref:hypothetical protein n=1 Tax=Pontibacillus sp. ALD_SL1 TaxID=2777185 RepID=UPI001A96FA01|nr:hypothetical protein [Pontibacillus sp. ALD_SL1]QST03100.1 hypothetical protein IMZ31_21360 [Pontibacillus sp. ALD_SL1]
MMKTLGVIVGLLLLSVGCSEQKVLTVKDAPEKGVQTSVKAVPEEEETPIQKSDIWVEVEFEHGETIGTIKSLVASKMDLHLAVTQNVWVKSGGNTIMQQVYSKESIHLTDKGEHSLEVKLDMAKWETGKYDIEVETLVKVPEGDEVFTYKTVVATEIKQSEADADSGVQNEADQYDFIPAQSTAYTYVDYQGDETTKEFLYVKQGVAQSVSEGGTEFLISEEDGLYFSSSSEVITDDRTMDTFQDKEMVLSYPLTVGQTWEKARILYTVVDVNASIEVPIGKLQHVIVVERGSSGDVRYYYHREYGLVQMAVIADENWIPIMQLKSVH